MRTIDLRPVGFRSAAAALGVAALVLSACAPLQRGGLDLGGPPARIDDPLDSGVQGRLARATNDPAACRAWLAASGVQATAVADTDEAGGLCPVRSAVKLGDDTASMARLSPARPMMTCRLAAAVSLWRRQSLAPAAREILGSEVRRIDHLGVYACRTVNNQPGGRLSAHAQAAAIDIGGFTLADGRKISVEHDWSGEGAKAAFLRRVRDDACRIFGVTLSPDYNAAHANHLHLEAGGGRLCS